MEIYVLELHVEDGRSISSAVFRIFLVVEKS